MASRMFSRNGKSVLPLVRLGGELHVHHWFRKESADSGHILWLCWCGVLVDWSVLRQAWEAGREPNPEQGGSPQGDRREGRVHAA